jgi:hypothetical protein
MLSGMLARGDGGAMLAGIDLIDVTAGEVCSFCGTCPIRPTVKLSAGVRLPMLATLGAD